MAKASAAARPAVDLSNLPTAPLPFFGGRDAFLADLQASLKAGNSIQVIHGLGGVGKTQVALEYARRHRAEHAIVWWVVAETESTIIQSYAKLAHRLGRVVSENASADVVRDMVKGALALRNDWLLVFDDARSAASIRWFFPPNPGGHVLITTRSSDVAPPGVSQPLDVFTRGESIEFLRQRCGGNEPESDLDRVSQALGDLPLALEQAAAVIAGSGLSFIEYLNRYEIEWGDMLQSGPPPINYPHTVAMTWGLAFAAVESASMAAAALLNFASFMCPDNVSNKMLRDGHDYLPESVAALASNPITLEKAMAVLGKYSLAQPQVGGVVIHRLVANVTRDRLTPHEQQMWCTAVIHFLSNGFQFDSADVRSWKKCGELLPHVLEAAAHADRLMISPDATAELLNSAGRYLLKKAQYVDARQALNRAMAINSRRYGDTHPKLSSIANNLGRVYEQMGEDNVAVRYFEMALSIDQATYGAMHPHVAEVINNYGICIQKQGDRTQARNTFAHAAHVYEQHYGPDHPKLANILNNLAYAMASIGEIDEAEPHLLRALTIAENTVGSEHPTTASILYNLSTSLRKRQQLPAARMHLERAMAIDLAALGPDHPNTRRDAEALSAFE